MFKLNYSITRGQLVTMWIACISWSIMAGTYIDYVEDGVTVFLWVSSIILWWFTVFYTLGWRNNKK